MRRLSPLFLIVPIVFLAACAAGPNDYVGTAADAATQPAGFWLGLWHGLIVPFTFFISLFTQNVSMYEVHNNVGWYDFGFWLGLGSAFGGGSSSARRRRLS